ncbi:MAG: hypothetical protein ABJU19_10890 [Roseobacter sp.]
MVAEDLGCDSLKQSDVGGSETDASREEKFANIHNRPPCVNCSLFF